MIDAKDRLVYDVGMPLLRKIIFYTFACFYLVFCPLLVLRMQGIILSPSTHRLVKTGLISINTSPAGANIIINGKLFTNKSPAVIRELPEGDNFIRIEKDGYQDWAKNIYIAPSKATLLNDITLIPLQSSINP